MGLSLYLRSTATLKQYKIIKVDKAAGIITLRGTHREFDEPYDKDRLKKMGYEMIQIEETADA